MLNTKLRQFLKSNQVNQLYPLTKKYFGPLNYLKEIGNRFKKSKTIIKDEETINTKINSKVNEDKIPPPNTKKDLLIKKSKTEETKKERIKFKSVKVDKIDLDNSQVDEELQVIKEPQPEIDKKISIKEYVKLKNTKNEDEKLISNLLDKIKIEEFYTSFHKLSPPVVNLSLFEKISVFEELEEGKIKTPHVYLDNKPRVFSNKEKYEKWKLETINELQRDIQYKLNPYEYYLTRSAGMERPFTGKYRDYNHVGVYSCKVCTQRLFSSTHKYKSDCGHATFWNYFPFTMKYSEDNLNNPPSTQSVIKLQFKDVKPVKRLSCSNCESNIGLVYNDGPAPFFKRLSVNSESIHFLPLSNIESPDEIKNNKKIEKINEIMEKDREEQYKYFERKRKCKSVVQFVNSNIVNKEMQLNSKTLSKDYDEYVANLNKTN